MSPVVLWGLLVLLCQQTLVGGHVLGRPSSAGDLTQLKSLLERFEETLTEAAQDEESEADYEGTNQEPEHSQARGWLLDQEEPPAPDRASPPAEGRSRASSQRNHLLDLLMTARKRSSGCFGARMDRIGNASGLGCNSGRG
ncbi:natriuretic peptides A [Salarias fasciatus]|uniref:natriuretic peptides A n=1 Tax=Salarias fasciatus TaxID=181472 RepID=UPI001176C168|nr:natriuretic peptides A-like [Salarias fasciatus]